MNINLFNGSENIQHSLDILKAAMPHLNQPAKHSIELALKTGELLETISDLSSPDQLSACDLAQEPIDMEAMLLQIQEVCTDAEKEAIHVILNFVKARKLYQTYQSVKGSNKPLGPFSNGSPFSNGLSSMMEFFTSQMPSEQKGMFDTMNMLFQTMNANT